MKLPDRFWIETISRLSDIGVAALLYSLGRQPEDLPFGVVRSEVPAWEATRFGWAAQLITSELATAAGTTYDPGVGLLVVWSVATAELPHGPGPARGWGRLIAKTQASWRRELVKRLGSQLRGATQAAFLAGLSDIDMKKTRSLAPMRPRPRADAFEVELVLAKKLEYQLRARFPDVDDLGTKPSPADRRTFASILAAGFTGEQVLDALRGQAEKCAKNRRWRDIDAAQSFLKVSWLCGDVTRLERAEQVGASLRQDPSGIVTGPAGNFAHGLEICTE